MLFKYNEIISHDIIMSRCDYAYINESKLQFHREIPNKCNLIKDLNLLIIIINSSVKLLNIFVYCELLNEFKPILDYIYKPIHLYIGNSDEDFDSFEICNHKNVNHIYAQNPVIIHHKLSLLPIGIENNMWYDNKKMISLINENKNNKKSKEMYVNLNLNTHPDRQVIFDKCQFKNNKRVSKEDYVKELSIHKKCVVIRGNGVDSHRFWSCVYLNVIPVFYFTPNEKMNNYLTNLRNTGIVFIEEKSIT